MIDYPPERDGYRCRRCGRELKFYHPTHGYRYWTCGRHSPPVVVMGPEIVDWSMADAAVIPQFGSPKPEDLDAGATDPLRFVDRLCERYQVCRQSAIDEELERRAGLSKQDSAGHDQQQSLSGWSQ